MFVRGSLRAPFIIVSTIGSYCDERGMTEVAGSCQEGYYCPTGSTQENEVPCPEGHFCEQGSSQGTRCAVSYDMYALGYDFARVVLCLTCSESTFLVSLILMVLVYSVYCIVYSVLPYSYSPWL